ncbi:MAG TPA: hypothetical protein VIX91_09600 [Candidatus Acidoferrum sp.]
MNSRVLSLLIAIFSTFPYRTQVGGNDAYILRQLLASKSGSIQMIAAHGAYFAGSAEPIVPAYFERWRKLASAESETLHSRYYVDWQASGWRKIPRSQPVTSNYFFANPLGILGMMCRQGIFLSPKRHFSPLVIGPGTAARAYGFAE